jgi:hypothetical protein
MEHPEKTFQRTVHIGQLADASSEARQQPFNLPAAAVPSQASQILGSAFSAAAM